MDAFWGNFRESINFWRLRVYPRSQECFKLWSYGMSWHWVVSLEDLLPVQKIIFARFHAVKQKNTDHFHALLFLRFCWINGTEGHWFIHSESCWYLQKFCIVLRSSNLGSKKLFWRYFFRWRLKFCLNGTKVLWNGLPDVHAYVAWLMRQKFQKPIVIEIVPIEIWFPNFKWKDMAFSWLLRCLNVHTSSSTLIHWPPWLVCFAILRCEAKEAYMMYSVSGFFFLQNMPLRLTWTWPSLLYSSWNSVALAVLVKVGFTRARLLEWFRLHWGAE